VPPALLAQGRAIVLQPRRAAARSIARRIANEQRWGYILGVVMAILDVVLIVLAAGGVMDVFRGTVLISFLFAIALVALLLHPMSREYQRIWFR